MKNSVTALSQLLGITPEIVEASLTDDSLVARIEDFKTGNKIFSNQDHEIMLKNAGEEYVNTLISSKKPLPKKLYDFAKGTVLDMEEKRLSKKFEITEYASFDDLVDRIIETKSTTTGNPEEIAKLKKEYKDKIEELTLALTKKDEENTESLKKIRLDNALELAYKSIYDKLEVSEEQKAKQMDLIKSSFLSKKKVDIEDDKIVVLEGEKVLKNKSLEPLTLENVIESHAVEYGFKLKSPDKGGLGGKSSASSNNTGFANIKNKKDFNDYCTSNNIVPNSMKGAELLGEIIKANPDFKHN
jgi:hypothetical protein